MKTLALFAFLGSLLAVNALYAQARLQGSMPSSTPLLDAPGPGYFEQRDRFAPTAGGVRPIRLRTQPFSFADPSSLPLLRIKELPPLQGSLSNGASFGIRAGESSEDRQERLEFERRFEELKARLERERLHPGGMKRN